LLLLGNIGLQKDGRVEAEGTLDEFLIGCQEMQRLWQGDLGKAGRTDADAVAFEAIPMKREVL